MKQKKIHTAEAYRNWAKLNYIHPPFFPWIPCGDPLNGSVKDFLSYRRGVSYIFYHTFFSAGNGRLWQQNLIQERKSSITQLKLMIFWWNKKLLKAYDLLLLSPEKKIELDFGHGLCWPSFCPNRVLTEQFVKALVIFFQNYNIVT